METIKPEPVPLSLVCSLCAEPWDLHGDEPTVLDCIRILKAKAPIFPSYPTLPSYPYPAYPVPGPSWGIGSGDSMPPNPKIWCSSVTQWDGSVFQNGFEVSMEAADAGGRSSCGI